MQDIQLVDNKLIFHRKIWHADDIFLAQCLWFHEDVEASTFTADLTVTLPTAVKAFLEHAFPAFFHQPVHAAAKEQLSKDVAKVYKQLRKKYEAEVAPRIPYWDKTYKHQKQALIWMRNRRATLLSFQMRLGKTVTSASFSFACQSRRTVVVAFDIGKWGWVKDCVDKKWNVPDKVLNEFNFTILDSAKRKIAYAWSEKFVIINYEAMPKYLDYLKESQGVVTDLIIFDECQKLTNTATRNWKLAKELVDSCPDARILPMSGTPIKNRVDDAFALFKLVGHPLGKSKAEFDRRFLVRSTAGRFTKTIGGQNLDFLSACMSNFMIRKTLAEVSDLPDKAHIKLFFPFGEWREKYLEAVQLALENRGVHVNASFIHSILNVTAQAKVPGMMEHLEQLVDAGEKVIIFTWYTEPLNMIEKALKELGIKGVRIDGSIDGKEKAARANAFQDDPDIMVCYANGKSAGHSINLSAASVIYVLNQPLSPKDLEQCLFRADHVEKKEKITIYYPIAIGEDSDEITVDIKMDQLNQEKFADIDQTIDGGVATVAMDSAIEQLFTSMKDTYGIKEKV